MIVNPSASHLKLFFTLRGSILLEIVPQIAGVMAWAELVVFCYPMAPPLPDGYHASGGGSDFGRNAVINKELWR